jgi:hypothetical protein
MGVIGLVVIRPVVILNEVKDLIATDEILRCAQDDKVRRMTDLANAACSGVERPGVAPVLQ